jgi:hypothetical protein
MGLQAGDNEMALTYGLFTGAGSRNWQIKAPGSYWSMDDAATATYNTLHQVWVRSPTAPPPEEVGEQIAGLSTDCKALKVANATAPSGVYWLKIDGTAVKAYCDMVTDDGGWMLALNYVRIASNNPSLLLRNVVKGFPLLGSPDLQTTTQDESWLRSSTRSGKWGHLNTATLEKARA